MLPFYRCLQGTCVLVQRVQRVGDFLQRTYHCAAVGCGCLVVRIFGGALLMRTRRRLAESRFRLGFRIHWRARSTHRAPQSLSVKRLADLGYTVEVKPTRHLNRTCRTARQLVARSVCRSFFTEKPANSKLLEITICALWRARTTAPAVPFPPSLIITADLVFTNSFAPCSVRPRT